MYVQCRGHYRLTESHWHHWSVNKNINILQIFAWENISIRQKAALTCLLSVRPDMPKLALVQSFGDFNLHVRLFHTALHGICRSVNIYHDDQRFSVLLLGTQRPAGFDSSI